MVTSVSKAFIFLTLKLLTIVVFNIYINNILAKPYVNSNGSDWNLYDSGIDSVATLTALDNYIKAKRKQL